MKLKEFVKKIELAEKEKNETKQLEDMAKKEKIKNFTKNIKKYSPIIKDRINTIILEGNFYLKVDESGYFINNDKQLDIKSGSHIIITPYAHGVYSDKFLNEISKAGVYLYKLDFYGNPVWGLYPQTKIFANALRSQVLLLEERNKDIRANLIQTLITKKLLSEEEQNLKVRAIKKNEDIKDYIDSVMGIEGTAARQYWENFKNENKLDSYFVGRATEGMKGNIKNVNATNIVSALLNLGYGILAHKITFELYENGLEPTLGFYHAIISHGRRYNLVWDIIEPYRIIIDRILIENIDDIDTESWKWEQPEKTRFLMLDEEPKDKFVALPNEYKKWIDVFIKNKNVPKTLLDDKNSILMDYKKALRECLRRINYEDKEIGRALGVINE